MRRRFEPAGVSPRCGAGLLSPIWLFPPEASPPTDASGARQGRGAFKNIEERREAGSRKACTGGPLDRAPSAAPPTSPTAGRRPLGPIVDSSGRMRTRRWGLRHLTRSSRSGRDRPHRFVIRDHLELDARGFEQRPLRKHRRQRIHLVGVFD